MKLDHLYALTDQNAVLQHAKFSVPAKREGYTVDDNARALVFAAKAETIWPNDRLAEFQRKLLAFLLLMQSDEGKFHNLMDYSQRIIDAPSVGDHLGRAIWAAGTVINSKMPAGMKNSARLVFDRALPWGLQSQFIRTRAYTCLGLAERFHADQDDPNMARNLRQARDLLLKEYDANATEGWDWFENTLTYDNARLSQALLADYQAMGEEDPLRVAEQSLSFLLKATTMDGKLIPVGNDGWYRKGGRLALYDQQPIDAGATVEATALAYKLTGREVYEKGLRQALGWFYGVNTKSVVLYEGATGACHDGVTPDGLNQNQGAESTISFLLGAAATIENLGENI